MTKQTLRGSNPHDLKKYNDALDNYLDQYEFVNLLNKNQIKVDLTNLPRFANNNKINMIKVKRLGSAGSTPTYYLEPSRKKLNKIIKNLKNNNNSLLGRVIVKKKIIEILKVFDKAEDKSISRTSIAKVVEHKLGYPCNRKLVRKVLDKSRSSQLKKKLNKIS